MKYGSSVYRKPKPAPFGVERMTDARAANKRVVLLGLFLAFVLTECVIYMERGLVNDIFA